MAVRWRAPGRVNLIGEHTDYNDGFAMPFAIDASCTATVERTTDGVVRVASGQRGDAVEVALADLAPGTGDWAAYVLGVVWALREHGAAIDGVAVQVDSSVPNGSGLSSSAALVCSVTTAVDDLFGLGLSGDDLLAVSRRAENDYVGAPTGGMDQLASLRCTAGNVLFCDMRTLGTEQVPFDVRAEGLAVLVVDTRAEHRHSDGEYGRRREGCERAARLLGVDALRDVTVDALDGALSTLHGHEELQRYVRHVVTEDARVLRTADLLRAGRIRDIGALLSQSQASMREDYRITIPEVDVAADSLVAAGALGARMTGGGFGGCVIGLLDAELVPSAGSAVHEAFDRHEFGSPDVFTVAPSQGARRD